MHRRWRRRLAAARALHVDVGAAVASPKPVRKQHARRELPERQSVEDVGAAPAAGRAGKGGSPPLPLPLAPGHLGGLALYSPSVEPAANVHGCGWGCTKQVGGGVRRRHRLRAACSAASSRREALSPGAAAKATRTACTTETSRDHPRSPEITRDLPRSPEISRDLPSDEGRLHDMSPAGLQRKRDEPARTARGGGIGRRNEGDGRRGAQVAVRKRVGARCHPELALRRRGGEQCSAAGGVGRPHRAQARWRWPSAACLPEGGELRPHLVGCVTAMSWTRRAQVWEGYDTTTVSLYSAPRAPRRRRVAPRT